MQSEHEGGEHDSPHSLESVESSHHESERPLVVLASALIILWVSTGNVVLPTWLAAVRITVVMMAAFLAHTSARGHVNVRLSIAAVTCVGLVMAGVLRLGVEIGREFGLQAWVTVILTCAALCSVSLLLSASPTRRLRTSLGSAMALILLSATTAAAVLHSAHRIDVFTFMDDGVKALLLGVNPYAIDHANIYDPVETAIFYGPGIVVDGRVTVGFPYLPTSLLGAVPGALVGDVRLSGLIALTLLSLTLVLLSPSLISRLAALTLVSGPQTLAVLVGSFTEPIQVALLGLTGLALVWRKPWMADLTLGLFFGTKQYLLVAVPSLIMLRGVLRPRHILAMVASLVTVVAPFALLNFGAMWHSVVEFHLTQPFRDDSMSALVLSVNELSLPPPSWYGPLPIALGLTIALVLLVRLPRSSSNFLLAVSLSVLASVLTSKQAYTNYYFFVGSGSLLAAALFEEAARMSNSGKKVAPAPEAHDPHSR